MFRTPSGRLIFARAYELCCTFGTLFAARVGNMVSPAVVFEARDVDVTDIVSVKFH